MEYVSDNKHAPDGAGPRHFKLDQQLVSKKEGTTRDRNNKDDYLTNCTCSTRTSVNLVQLDSSWPNIKKSGSPKKLAIFLKFCKTLGVII